MGVDPHEPTTWEASGPTLQAFREFERSAYRKLADLTLTVDPVQWGFCGWVRQSPANVVLGATNWEWTFMTGAEPPTQDEWDLQFSRNFDLVADFHDIRIVNPNGPISSMFCDARDVWAQVCTVGGVPFSADPVTLTLLHANRQYKVPRALVDQIAPPFGDR